MKALFSNDHFNGQFYFGAIKQGLLILFALVVVRVLSKNEYGEYAYLSSLVILASLFFSLGFSSFVMGNTTVGINLNLRYLKPLVRLRLLISTILFAIAYIFSSELIFSFYLTIFYFNVFILDNIFSFTLHHYALYFSRSLSLFLKVILLVGLSFNYTINYEDIFKILLFVEFCLTIFGFIYIRKYLPSILVSGTSIRELWNKKREFLKYYTGSLLSSLFLPSFYIAFLLGGVDSDVKADSALLLNMSFLFITFFSLFSKFESNITAKVKSGCGDELYKHWINAAIFLFLSGYSIFFNFSHELILLVFGEKYIHLEHYFLMLIPIIFLSHTIYLLSPEVYKNNKYKYLVFSNIFSGLIVLTVILFVHFFDYVISVKELFMLISISIIFRVFLSYALMGYSGCKLPVDLNILINLAREHFFTSLYILIMIFCWINKLKIFCYLLGIIGPYWFMIKFFSSYRSLKGIA